MVEGHENSEDEVFNFFLKWSTCYTGSLRVERASEPQFGSEYREKFFDLRHCEIHPTRLVALKLSLTVLKSTWLDNT